MANKRTSYNGKFLTEFLDYNMSNTSALHVATDPNVRELRSNTVGSYAKDIKRYVAQNLRAIATANKNAALLETLPSGKTRKTTLPDSFNPVNGVSSVEDFRKFLLLRDVTSTMSEQDDVVDEALAIAASGIEAPGAARVMTKNENAIVKNIRAQAALKIIQTFYTMYMSNVGVKEIDYRLGTVSAVINNRSLIANKTGMTTSNGAIFTPTNVAFDVGFDIVDPKTGKNVSKSQSYANLFFPPYTIPIDGKGDLQDNTDYLGDKVDSDDPTITPEDQPPYSLDTLISNRPGATYRFAGFKAVNDNIMLLQQVMENCFGVVSTAMPEWDISLYMQEGIVDAVKNNADQTTYSFVTKLTYRMGLDAPQIVPGVKNSILQAATFGAVNAAVSVMKPDDSHDIPWNELEYRPELSPYSAWWSKYHTDSNYWVEDIDNPGQLIKTVPQFWNCLLDTTFNTDVHSGGPVALYDKQDKTTRLPFGKSPSLIQTGKLAGLLKLEQFDIPNAIGTPAEGITATKLSPRHFLGILPNYRDGWQGEINSTFLKTNLPRLLEYIDSRNAALSGWRDWNTPFWKLFYTDEGDGMTTIDTSMEDIESSSAPYSVFSAANAVFAGIMDVYNDESYDNYIQGAQSTIDASEQTTAGASVPYGNEGNTGNGSSYSSGDWDNPLTNQETAPDSALNQIPFGAGDGSFGESDIKILKVRLRGSALLKLFLKKGSIQKAAMRKADSSEAGGMAYGDPTSTTGCGILDKAIASGALGDEDIAAVNNKTVPVLDDDGNQVFDDDGNPVTEEVEETVYEVGEDAIKDQYSNGAGVCQFSPFIFGGPHGKSYSPDTMEAVFQRDNLFLRYLPKLPTIEETLSRRKTMSNFYNKEVLFSESSGEKATKRELPNLIETHPYDKTLMMKLANTPSYEDLVKFTEGYIPYDPQSFFPHTYGGRYKTFGILKDNLPGVVNGTYTRKVNALYVDNHRGGIHNVEGRPTYPAGVADSSYANIAGSTTKHRETTYGHIYNFTRYYNVYDLRLSEEQRRKLYWYSFIEKYGNGNLNATLSFAGQSITARKVYDVLQYSHMGQFGNYLFFQSVRDRGSWAGPEYTYDGNGRLVDISVWARDLMSWELDADSGKVWYRIPWYQRISTSHYTVLGAGWWSNGEITYSVRMVPHGGWGSKGNDTAGRFDTPAEWRWWDKAYGSVYWSNGSSYTRTDSNGNSYTVSTPAGVYSSGSCYTTYYPLSPEPAAGGLLYGTRPNGGSRFDIPFHRPYYRTKVWNNNWGWSGCQYSPYITPNRSEKFYYESVLDHYEKVWDSYSQKYVEQPVYKTVKKSSIFRTEQEEIYLEMYNNYDRGAFDLSDSWINDFTGHSSKRYYHYTNLRTVYGLNYSHVQNLLRDAFSQAINDWGKKGPLFANVDYHYGLTKPRQIVDEDAITISLLSSITGIDRILMPYASNGAKRLICDYEIAQTSNWLHRTCKSMDVYNATHGKEGNPFYDVVNEDITLWRLSEMPTQPGWESGARGTESRYKDKALDDSQSTVTLPVADLAPHGGWNGFWRLRLFPDDTPKADNAAQTDDTYFNGRWMEDNPYAYYQSEREYEMVKKFEVFLNPNVERYVGLKHAGGITSIPVQLRYGVPYTLRFWEQRWRLEYYYQQHYCTHWYAILFYNQHITNYYKLWGWYKDGCFWYWTWRWAPNWHWCLYAAFYYSWSHTYWDVHTRWVPYWVEVYKTFTPRYLSCDMSKVQWNVALPNSRTTFEGDAHATETKNTIASIYSLKDKGVALNTGKDITENPLVTSAMYTSGITKSAKNFAPQIEFRGTGVFFNDLLAVNKGVPISQWLWYPLETESKKQYLWYYDYGTTDRYNKDTKYLWTADDYDQYEQLRTAYFKRSLAEPIKRIVTSYLSAPWYATNYHTLNMPRMVRCKINTTLNYYISIMRKQVAWLKTLETIAQTVTTDTLIMETMRSVVDPKVYDTVDAFIKGKTLDPSDQAYFALDGKTHDEDLHFDIMLDLCRQIYDHDLPNNRHANNNTLYDLANKRRVQLEGYINTLETWVRNDYIGNPAKCVDMLQSTIPLKMTDIKDTVYSTHKYSQYIYAANANNTAYGIDIKSPELALLSYLEVLYHYRKYFINKRFNKQDGSYWGLRHIEKLLPTMLTILKTSDDLDNLDDNDSNAASAISLPVAFMDLDNTLLDKGEAMASEDATPLQPDNVAACYIKVDYLTDVDARRVRSYLNGNDGYEVSTEDKNAVVYRDPDTNELYYKGNRIVYVRPTGKYAIVPPDGLWMMTSKEIENEAKAYVASVADYNAEIDEANKDKTYVIDETVVNELEAHQSNISRINTYYFNIEWKLPNVISNNVAYKNAVTREDTDIGPNYAGILFNAVDNVNLDNIATFGTALTHASAMEMLCSAIQGADFWYVKVPSEVAILAADCTTRPMLVKKETFAESIKNKKPSKLTTVAGVMSNVVYPVCENASAIDQSIVDEVNSAGTKMMN